MDFNIVISFYNNHNYINLLQAFDNFLIKYNAFIYNKSNNEIKIEVPKFDVQIIDNADYQRFLRNPKFPSGTVFIDPEGQRRTKR